jgi:hypothetical protein
MDVTSSPIIERAAEAGGGGGEKGKETRYIERKKRV